MSYTIIKEGGGKAPRHDLNLRKTVEGILADVRERGEAALLDGGKRFEGVQLDTVRVDPVTVKGAAAGVKTETVESLRFAAARIRAFASRQLECLRPLHYLDSPGVELGHRFSPVESVGCYVPGGRYPLPSSALMSVVTARVAGVKRVAACSPAFPGGGGIHPAVLAALDIAGVDEVFCMGGAQAIAAFAYGAGPVKKVDFIAGPGNRFVTEAKRQVLGEVGIDSLAGPSEALIIADRSADPRYAALDLLAQGEHDHDARPMLITTDRGFIDRVLSEIDLLLKHLPSSDIARVSWEAQGRIYLVDSLEDAAVLANEIAPEHLELQVKPGKERPLMDKLRHYGSLFVGHHAPVALGDFVSGTNHILPTLGAARFSGGLWVGSFLRIQFHQIISPEGCRSLVLPAIDIAETEGLHAHQDSLRVRLRNFD